MAAKTKEEHEQYLGQHRILELFEDLCTALAYHKPEDPRAFIIEQLEALQRGGGVALPVFTRAEVENVFRLYNLKNEATITQQRAREALKCLAHTRTDIDTHESVRNLPAAVDLSAFMGAAADIVHIGG